MKVVDLSHTLGLHTPGWVGYPSCIMEFINEGELDVIDALAEGALLP